MSNRQKITDLETLNSQPDSNDYLVGVDTDDTTMSTNGTNKKIQAPLVAETPVRATTITTAGTTTTIQPTNSEITIFTGSSNQNVQLPPANSWNTGYSRKLIIKNESTGSLTTLRAESDTIDGETSVNVSSGSSLVLVCNGSDKWLRIFDRVEWVLSDYTDLDAALTAIGSTTGSLVIDTTATLTGATVIPSTLALRFIGAGLIDVQSFSLTVNGELDAPETQWLFDVTSGGSVIFAIGSVAKVWVDWFCETHDRYTDITDGVRAAYAAAAANTIPLQYGPGEYYHDTLFRVNKTHILGAGMRMTTINNFDGKDLFSWDHENAQGDTSTNAVADHFIGDFGVRFKGDTDTSDTLYSDRCGPGGENLANVVISRGERPATSYGASLSHGKIRNIWISADAPSNDNRMACITDIAFNYNIENVVCQSMGYGVIGQIRGVVRASSVSGANIVLDELPLKYTGDDVIVDDRLAVIYEEDDNPTETFVPRVGFRIATITGSGPYTVTLKDDAGNTLSFATSPSAVWVAPANTTTIEQGYDLGAIRCCRFTCSYCALSIYTATDMGLSDVAFFSNRVHMRIFNADFGGWFNSPKQNSSRCEAFGCYFEGPFNAASVNAVVKIEGSNHRMHAITIGNRIADSRFEVTGSNNVFTGCYLYCQIIVEGDNNVIEGTMPIPVSDSDRSYHKVRGANNKVIRTAFGSSGLTSTAVVNPVDAWDPALPVEFAGQDIDNDAFGPNAEAFTYWPTMFRFRNNIGMIYNTDFTVVRTDDQDVHNGMYMRLLTPVKSSGFFTEWLNSGRSIRFGSNGGKYPNIPPEVCIIAARVRLTSGCTPDTAEIRVSPWDSGAGTSHIGASASPAGRASIALPVSGTPENDWRVCYGIFDLSDYDGGAYFAVRLVGGGQVGFEMNWLRVIPMRQFLNSHKVITRELMIPRTGVTAHQQPDVAVDATGFHYQGTKVVGAQGAAVDDATGTGDIVAQFNTLLARLRAHGLISS
jgi:hypothetical protein